MINEMNTESILGEVLGHENLNAAYLAVKANNGAAGVDKMNIERTREHLLQHWETIESKLLEGRTPHCWQTSTWIHWTRNWKVAAWPL